MARTKKETQVEVKDIDDITENVVKNGRKTVKATETSNDDANSNLTVKKPRKSKAEKEAEALGLTVEEYSKKLEEEKKQKELEKAKEAERKRLEKEEKARKIAEKEAARKLAEEQARKEAEEKAKREAEDAARKLAEEQAAKEAEAKAKKESNNWHGDADLYIQFNGKKVTTKNQFKTQVSPLYGVEEYYWTGKIDSLTDITFVRKDGTQIPVHEKVDHGYNLVGNAMRSFECLNALAKHADFEDHLYVYIKEDSVLRYIGDNNIHTYYIRIYDNAKGNFNDRWVVISME